MKAKIVCAKCNNEWMSRLEKLVKPILTPMLTGQSIDLDPAKQVALCQWGIKTAMVLEHTLERPETDLYWSKQERRTFATTPHRRPAEAQVFLGRYSGTKWKGILRGGRQIATFGSGEPAAPMTRSTIVCSGVILYVTADRYTATTGRTGFIWPPPHFDKVEPLAERATITWRWPFELSLDEEQLAEFLTNRWRTATKGK